MEKTKDIPRFAFTKIVQILDDKSYRQYMPIRNWEELWNIYIDEPIKYRYLFEVIRSDQPCKPYLDIEWNVNKNENAKKIDYADFVEKLRTDIISVFKNRYDIQIDNTDILVLTSHSEKKTSFHVIINKEYDDGSVLVYKTNRKYHKNSAWDLWAGMVELDKTYSSKLDEAVYTLDREFRTIYSNKYNDFRPIIPYGDKIRINSRIKMKCKDILKYMVTHIPISCERYIETSDNTINTKYMYNGVCVPTIYDSKQHIKNIVELARTVHPTAYYTGISSCGKGYRFSYINRTELCYTGIVHRSNGFYVFTDTKNGTIYMKCMSSNCKTTHILNRTKSNKVCKKIF